MHRILITVKLKSTILTWSSVLMDNLYYSRNIFISSYTNWKWNRGMHCAFCKLVASIPIARSSNESTCRTKTALHRVFSYDVSSRVGWGEDAVWASSRWKVGHSQRMCSTKLQHPVRAVWTDLLHSGMREADLVVLPNKACVPFLHGRRSHMLRVAFASRFLWCLCGG